MDMNNMDSSNKELDENSSGEEAGKFVRIPRNISSDSVSGKNEVSEEESSDDDMKRQDLKTRYKLLLQKLKNERQKNKMVDKSKRRAGVGKDVSFMNSSRSLAERIRGWQILELEKLDDHKHQYHAWLAFKSIVEANWEMYEIQQDKDKLMCLQTKCKGFVVELTNSIHRVKPNFQDIWCGLQTRFYAPINSGEETLNFYQMKQSSNENIFNFFERVTKQAYLCNFSTNDYARNIGETFARNCLNPAYFLGFFDKLDDLDKLKHHARNFHAALPRTKHEPVLAIDQRSFRRDFRNNDANTKRRLEDNYNDSQKRRRTDSTTNFNHAQRNMNCRYCGETTCNRRNCPARGQKCNYCQRFDHFEKACFKKKANAINEKRPVNMVAKIENEEKVNLDDNSQ